MMHIDERGHLLGDDRCQGESMDRPLKNYYVARFIKVEIVTSNSKSDLFGTQSLDN